MTIDSSQTSASATPAESTSSDGPQLNPILQTACDSFVVSQQGDGFRLTLRPDVTINQKGAVIERVGMLIQEPTKRESYVDVLNPTATERETLNFLVQREATEKAQAELRELLKQFTVTSRGDSFECEIIDNDKMGTKAAREMRVTALTDKLGDLLSGLNNFDGGIDLRHGKVTVKACDANARNVLAPIAAAGRSLG